VLASLRAAYPGAAIDWLVQDSFRDAVAAHPALSAAIPFPRREFAAWWRPGVLGAFRDWLGSLAKGSYDLVLDCQGLARSGLFAWSTRAPRRIGYADARELGWLGVTERVRVPATFHSVDRMLALVEAAGIEAVRDMRLYAPPADREAVAHESLGSIRYALLAPTSRWPGKQWSADRFAGLARELLARGGFEAVVLVGARNEREQIAPLLRLAEGDRRVIDLVGETSIGRLMAIVERAALVVANDSAALHMAVGFDRPLIALYGPTRVDLVGPYGHADRVVQHVRPGDVMDHKNAAAGRAMMDRIALEEVVARAMR
jgi:ADP-heptose:LPS heptosyltransferase